MSEIKLEFTDEEYEFLEKASKYLNKSIEELFYEFIKLTK